MQSVSFRIWTRVTVSISYGDNHYTMGTSKESTDIVFLNEGQHKYWVGQNDFLGFEHKKKQKKKQILFKIQFYYKKEQYWPFSSVIITIF